MEKQTFLLRYFDKQIKIFSCFKKDNFRFYELQSFLKTLKFKRKFLIKNL